MSQSSRRAAPALQGKVFGSAAGVGIYGREIEKAAFEHPRVASNATWQLEPACIGVEKVDLTVVDNYIAVRARACADGCNFQLIMRRRERELGKAVGAGWLWWAREASIFDGRRREKPVAEQLSWNRAAWWWRCHRSRAGCDGR